MTSCSVSQKFIRKWIRPSRPKRDLEIQTIYGPQILQRGTYGQWNICTPSKVGHDACPVRRGLVASVKCCVRNARFFSCRAGCGTEEEKPEPCVGFNNTKGKPWSAFCFPIP